MPFRFSDLFPVLGRVALPPPSLYLPCNPSVCPTEEGWRCLVRTLNYRLSPDGKLFLFHPPLRIDSLTWDFQLADDLQPVRWTPVEDASIRRAHAQVNQGGFEDARLFRWRGGWWCIATVATFRDGTKTGMALAELTDEGPRSFTYLPSPFGRPIEKNWAPCVDGDDLYLVYSVSPTFVLRFDGRALHAAARQAGSHRIAGWSGSSQLVDWGGDRLTVIHRKTVKSNPFGQNLLIYQHRFVLLDKGWNTVALSRSFVFESLGVEFCAGLAVKGGRAVLSYGINDSQAILVATTTEAIDRALQPLASGPAEAAEEMVDEAPDRG